jgi:cytochrome c oxidase assembly protein subunit 11
MADAHREQATPAPPTPWEGDRPAAVDPTRRRNRRLLIVLACVGLGMFGFAFANVPLFTLICQRLGIAPNPGMGKATFDGTIGREIEVRFTGAVWGQLPVEFRPVNSLQRTRLGEMTVNDYVFINLSRRPVYFRPIHGILPVEASREDRYELGECFCYDEMMLQPGQQLTLPVVYRFHQTLSPSVRAITMSYTLFPITPEEYERAQSQKGGDKERGP